jgi:cytochrome P450
MTVDDETGQRLDILVRFASPEFQRDPYPFFHELRERDPVHLTSKGFYLAMRHADSSFVLSEVGGLFRAPELEMLMKAMPEVTERRTQWMLVTCLMARNPPEHTRLRRLVARHFTPHAAQKLHGDIGRICDSLIDSIVEPLRDGEVVDLHHEISEKLPLLLIAQLLGVPAADHGWMITAVHDMAAGLTAAATSGGAEALLRADEQTIRMENCFRELAAERRKAPGDDLISGLTRMHDEDPDRLTDDELVNLVWLLWLAGTDANTVTMDHCLWSIFEFTDQCHWLAGDHASAVAFVDEVLRRTPPVIFSPLPRLAVRDVEVGGITYPAGTDIKPCFAAANRDPEVFEDPDRFDPSRPNTGKLLTFSGGIHHCLGVFLARAGLAMASSRLYTRLPGLSCLDEPRWGGLAVDPATRGIRVVLEEGR